MFLASMRFDLGRRSSCWSKVMPTNSEARKGIKTEEGALMADKAFQLDRNATDADGDGKIKHL